MTNAEIRAKAKKRRSRQKGLVPIAFAQGGFMAAMYFVTTWTRGLDPWLGIPLYALLLTVSTLISGAGCVYAAAPRGERAARSLPTCSRP